MQFAKATFWMLAWILINGIVIMKIENNRRLSITISICLILYGLSQWFYPSQSSMRWRWLQDITNNLFGEHGHAKFLLYWGGIWSLWNIYAVFEKNLKKDTQCWEITWLYQVYLYGFPSEFFGFIHLNVSFKKNMASIKVMTIFQSLQNAMTR